MNVEEHIAKTIQGKKILVTGAAGSIGRKLVLTLLEYQPQKIILLDHSEYSLYEFLMQLGQEHCTEAHICDIRNENRVQYLLDQSKPDIVLHAAAYKHVPLMENNAIEAVDVNVFGTSTMINCCLKGRVKQFVLISTDKAFKPSSVMGASKRIAEMVCQKVASQGELDLTIVRFGNVLNTKGSVMPAFRNQIKEGGPITLTDQAATRFFMTLSEACSLVLISCGLHESGLYVFDMGEPVKIIDLALKTLKEEGADLDDIGIQTIGLRPGEKLNEELPFSLDDKKLEPTPHPKIYQLAVEKEMKTFQVLLDKLLFAVKKNNDQALVQVMKQIVPDFRSMNSPFQSLDQ